MISKVISSRRNPLVKRLKAISSKPGREEHSMLLLEGTHLLEEAIKTDFTPLEIVATSSWIEKNTELLKYLPEKILIIEVTKSVLEASLTTFTPDGVASLFPLSGLPSIPDNPEYILALDYLQDPGNLGNLFRTALAADIEMLWLGSGADPLNQKVIRASAGSILHMPYERFGQTESEGVELLITKLREAVDNGFQVVATSVPSENQSQSVIPYWEIDWNKPTVLVLGNEGSGLHEDIKNCCNQVVTLPHSKVVESLNVAAAAVPLLLERRRAKMKLGIHQ
ncbi:RNA methyltransferase [Prochlorococcus sp. MIT 1223]|uniref:TrmH family RNA methyltransferase n=1 Tax=Prochlorococcus sp. MIT 1223 TaxID=3096217 RepID=UPI002A75F6DB|nr:RNA methyltransferase [Prochlorococcus sp. MIT 1223]